MENPDIQQLCSLLKNSIKVQNGQVVITDRNLLRSNIHQLAEISAFGSGSLQGYARYLIRLIANKFGSIPTSIHDLYMARARGELPQTFSVPALNLRMLTFDTAKAVFRAAKILDAKAFIFEIARSEMGYTDQRPVEYVASVLSAAIAEGYVGPVFIQGDHFQASSKRYASNPDVEINALQELIIEAIDAGFYNIDIDTSTLVDITKPTIPEQQETNCTLSADLSAFIRAHQPEGVTISIGGEIGEVGGHNSTIEELRAYMNGYINELSSRVVDPIGISKISIQTGTSHGGVVLPDGSIAQVNLDFETLHNLSQAARKEYCLGGAVQHGASTLPADAFSKFVTSEAIEVHLATNFQNMVFDHLPNDLKIAIYSFLDSTMASERKPGMTDEQFYYKTRKNAIGQFKSSCWHIADDNKHVIVKKLEDEFVKLFRSLGVNNTHEYVTKTIKPVIIQPELKNYLGDLITEQDVADLAD